MKNLTPRQREVLQAILDYRAEKGYAPSIRELGKILGISSLRGVTVHLTALEKKGWIERESTSRSIRILSPIPTNSTNTSASRVIPLLGTIAAGQPLLAVENVESYIHIPEEVASHSFELFALRVKGDSMIGDHILDGDTIIVENRPTAENGDIVAALIDDEATVKRLDTKSRPPRLLPSNPIYPPIEIEGEKIRILGKVVGLIRKYTG
jgi:repressor LexA